jgi:tripeptide aminopeptidase
MPADLTINPEAAIDRLMRFLAVEGITGQEKAIAAEVTKALVEVGIPADAIRYDDAHETIALPTQTGNLIVTMPGTRPGPRLLFSTHLDTVPLCAGAVPVRVGKRIKAKEATALGGDNRTGCAALVTMVATLLEKKIPHPPLTLLFTVREESGLFGARHLDKQDLGDVKMGFNVDGKHPNEITIGAVGAERWTLEVIGKASHAGAHPEEGISATLIAAMALAQIRKEGWFGLIEKDGNKGTSNVGSFGGKNEKSAGNATNVVTDYAYLTGEARSHDAKFIKEIIKAYKTAFTDACDQITDVSGKKGKVKFVSQLDYHPFLLAEDAPVVKTAMAAGTAAGLSPYTRVSNGGLDANWLVKHGIPTITFGAGQCAIHTIEEYVEIDLFLKGCKMALALATWQG